ncbi:uncharacterized protein [Chamaea fasciata]|uniref:uncharacterized protein n=1 Tax=Chamaea fasciata TaxID=190680 RepID=UPI003369FA71
MQDSIPQRKEALQRPWCYPRTPETLLISVAVLQRESAKETSAVLTEGAARFDYPISQVKTQFDSPALQPSWEGKREHRSLKKERCPLAGTSEPSCQFPFPGVLRSLPGLSRSGSLLSTPLETKEAKTLRGCQRRCLRDTWEHSHIPRSRCPVSDGNEQTLPAPFPGPAALAGRAERGALRSCREACQPRQRPGGLGEQPRPRPGPAAA